MVTGQDDSGLLIEEIGRPIYAAISLVVEAVSPAGHHSGGRAGQSTGEGDRHVSATDRSDGHEPEQLVPPRDRLLALLERNEGRMRQSDIVEVVEWSESTVSRKLGELEAAGAITRYRIGRGKIVFLPGAEPDCVGSPFEREEEEEEERKRPLAA